MITTYIPTMGRIGKQVTYHNFPEMLQENTFLVAPAEDADQLDVLGYPVIAQPEGVRGIAPTRQWIIDQHDTAALGENLLMADDDLRFLERRQDDPAKFRKVDGDPVAFEAMLSELEAALEYSPMAGISNRGGGNWHTTRFQLNRRIFDSWGVHVPTVRDELGLRVDEVTYMEDFNLSLHLLTRGYPVPQTNRYAKDDSGSNAEGGCSIFRDADSQRAAALELESRWPKFVRAREKKSANWGAGLDTRWDVRIAWKKAFEAGRAARDLLGEEQVELPEFFYAGAWDL